MNPLKNCLLKNKFTEQFIYSSDNQFILPERYEKYRSSDVDKMKTKIENSSSNIKHSSINNLNTNQILINQSYDIKNNNYNHNFDNDNLNSNNEEKRILFIEIENIIEELELFQKETRKNQMIEIMKSIVENVDKTTIPDADEIMDQFFFGKSIKEIEENYLKEKLLQEDKLFQKNKNKSDNCKEDNKISQNLLSNDKNISKF